MQYVDFACNHAANEVQCCRMRTHSGRRFLNNAITKGAKPAHESWYSRCRVAGGRPSAARSSRSSSESQPNSAGQSVWLLFLQR